MSFTFFTLGGMQFWGDVFYYKKWRIQYNCLTNKYRLLDKHDIRRQSGTYAECLNAFHNYKEAYQLSTQTESMMMMIHGLAETKGKFNKLIKAAEQNNYLGYAVTYPSTRQDLKNDVNRIETLLNNLENVYEVSFITHGIGGLIVRELLNSNAEWLKKIKIKRIVQINPPNREGRLWNKMNQYIIMRWIFGPILKQYDSKNIAKVAMFPKNVHFGILCTHNPLVDKILSFMPASWQKLAFKKDDAFLTGAKDAINIKIWRLDSCSSKKTLTACINFLKKGNFGI